MEPMTVIKFWFDELDPAKWWTKDPEFDALLRERFGDIHRQACAGELAHWRKSTEGRLAEIILLDQISRNIYRNSPLAFASDAMALALSQEAIACGAYDELESPKRGFLILPFMHSESKKIHEQAVELFTKEGADALKYEIEHKAIIDRFGRYPHRNEALGRESTAEELEFLNQPGSSF